jgi:hypothetical protein
MFRLDAVMEATRTFSPDQFARALESWQWIGLASKVALFASPFGDVFFQADDGLWWLDTLQGTLTRPWNTAEALNADLATTDGQDQYLLLGLAIAAEQRGIIPAANQVYAFTVPPALGGALDIDNIETIDFVVGMHIAGQIHDQVRNLPPGTRISGITINENTRPDRAPAAPTPSAHLR